MSDPSKIFQGQSFIIRLMCVYIFFVVIPQIIRYYVNICFLSVIRQSIDKNIFQILSNQDTEAYA